MDNLNSYDCIVVGLGGMSSTALVSWLNCIIGHGSSALAHISEKGLKTLGIERFQRTHAYGSSHGKSRIIRQAYFEDPKCLLQSISRFVSS